MIQSPQSFIVREECEKAAWQNGFRRLLGQDTGWAAFGSTTADGTIHLAAAGSQGPWFVALDPADLVAELGLPTADMTGPARFRLAFDTLGALYEALHRVYELTVSLPDAPLRAFETQIAGLPRATEVERQVVQRIGQDIFRDRLMNYWQGRCPLTGISDPELLRASHIVPWAQCTTDADRLNVHNGLLLSALWDAAFDRGLVSFDCRGVPMFSEHLSGHARSELGSDRTLNISEQHDIYLEFHRNTVFKSH